MSIPKEPRQLMINLMYLVLTAMLALNVSAEIINAFFSLNKGIAASSNITSTSNEKIHAAIDKQVEAYKNDKSLAAQSVADKSTSIVKDFESYIKGVISEMIEKAGGIDDHYTDGRPKRYKDKDVTTNMFITEGKGAEIEGKIKATRDALLALFPDSEERRVIESQLALTIEDIPADSKAKNWPELKFKQMPVAAVMPLLTKLIADAKSSETAILNKTLEKLGITEEIKFDQFKVAIAPKQGYVIQGEKFEADVYLAAYTSNPGAGISISVPGYSSAMKEGVASISRVESNLGKQKVNASATIKNPLTGKVTSVTSSFEYEVGRRSAALSADKMNVFYIGVDNPISIAVAGASSNQIQVSGSGGGINITGSGTSRMVRVSTPGASEITVSAPGISQKFPFRVKRIPDPTAQLGGGPNKRGGQMGSGEFKAQLGIAAILENFDFEAKCDVQGFELTRVRKNEDPVSTQNGGPRWGDKAGNLVNSAKPGDTFLFDDIKAKCPGDQVARNIGTLQFRIR
jgi:gliding motility-associated protein GldM